LETDSSLISERILEVSIALSRRLSTPIRVDSPEHTAMKAARRGFAALKAERIEGQSDITVPLIGTPPMETDVLSCLQFPLYQERPRSTLILMTKAEQLVAAIKLSEPDRTEDEILADLLNRGLIFKGYLIDESMELESNIGRPGAARLVKKWVVVKDGRPEYRADTEFEAMQYRDQRLQEDERKQ
jgi:hypothetical protein